MTVISRHVAPLKKDTITRNEWDMPIPWKEDGSEANLGYCGCEIALLSKVFFYNIHTSGFFSNYLLSPFQNEAPRNFDIKRLCIRPRFETEAKRTHLWPFSRSYTQGLRSYITGHVS